MFLCWFVLGISNITTVIDACNVQRLDDVLRCTALPVAGGHQNKVASH